MTAKELINKLNQLPENTEVIVTTFDREIFNYKDYSIVTTTSEDGNFYIEI